VRKTKRILFITHGSTGDTLPLLQLAGQLAKEEQDILFFASGLWADDATYHQVPLHPIPPTGNREDHALLMRTYTRFRNNRKLLEAMYGDINEWLPEYLPTLEREVAKADLLVCSYLFPFYKALAESAGIPTIAVHFCPNTYYSMDRPVDPIPELPSFFPQKLRRIYTRFMMKQGDLTMTRCLNRKLTDSRLYMKSWLIRPADFSLYLVPRELFLPDEERLAPHCAFTGFPSGGFRREKHTRPQTRLAEVPLLSFGSVTCDDMDRQFRHFYAAWPKDEPLLLQKGWHKPPPPPADSRIQLIEPGPHDLIFPKVEMILHHGGAGTTIAALRSGKPQIIIPHFADQNYWAKTVERLSVGRRCPSSQWGRILAREIVKLKNQPRYAEKAKTIAPFCIDPESGPRAARQLLQWASRS